MAFPTIPTVAAGDLLSSTTSPASTTHTFPNLSSLRGGAGPQAGDLLIAVVVQYGAATAGNQFSSWGASFVERLDNSENATGTGAVGVATKVAAGTESGTFTVTSVQAHKSAQFLMRIPAGTWHGTTVPEVLAAVRAAGAAADPGSFDPAGWAAEDTLWIAVAGQTETTTTGSPPVISGAPTNYSGELIVARVADAVGDITAAVAFRQVNASAEDVGVWTGSNFARGNGIATVIAVRPVAMTTETPTPGGATAGGPAPAPSVTETIAGATGDGLAPGPRSSVTIAGAVAQGVGAAARADVPAGGALAGGYGPAAPISETTTIGGAVASGNSPAATSSVASSGATASGIGPSERLSETTTIGGAAAAGSSPTAFSSSTIAGALAGGASPTARVTLTISGALAGGVAPTETVPGGDVVPAGGATAGGFAPSPSSSSTIAGGVAAGVAGTARVSLTIAGALAGGYGPQIPGSDTPTPGGALAGGFAPAASATSSTGGAIAGGLEVSAFVLVAPGGAIADGFTILIAQGVYADPETGRIDRILGGSIVGAENGRLEQPITGRTVL